MVGLNHVDLWGKICCLIFHLLRKSFGVEFLIFTFIVRARFKCYQERALSQTRLSLPQRDNRESSQAATPRKQQRLWLGVTVSWELWPLRSRVPGNPGCWCSPPPASTCCLALEWPCEVSLKDYASLTPVSLTPSLPFSGISRGRKTVPILPQVVPWATPAFLSLRQRYRDPQLHRKKTTVVQRCFRVSLHQNSTFLCNKGATLRDLFLHATYCVSFT